MLKIAAAFVTGLVLCAATLAAAAADLLDTKPRIAVVSAFEPEWIALKAQLAEPAEHDVNGRAFITGKLAGKDIVLFLSGVSMVNAAMTTQAALDRFSITHMVFSGIAGGVDPALNIGDVVVADQWGQYLEAVFARETPEGFVIPPFMQKEGFDGYGMIVPRSVAVTRKGAKGEERRFWFGSDPGLLEAARKVASRLKLEDCVAENKCLAKPPKIVVGGNGVSGQAFVDNAKFREYVMATFGPRSWTWKARRSRTSPTATACPSWRFGACRILPAAARAQMKWRPSWDWPRSTRPRSSPPFFRRSPEVCGPAENGEMAGEA